MGRYLERHEGRDTHNTYIRCAAELGLPGLILFAALIVNAFRMMRLVARAAEDREEGEELAWQCFALRIALIMYLICGIFGSFNYIEMMWWLLLLPSALERVVANANPVDLVGQPG
jgi:O-antigen ligase